MKKLIFPIAILFLMAVSCSKSEKKAVTTDVAFARYVQAFTSGVISSESSISVYMTQPVEGDVNTEELFRFEPEVKGKTVLVGGRVFEFRPEKPLKPGTTYKAVFALGKVLTVDSKLQTMPFEFATVKQTYSITVEGLKNYEGLNSTQMQLTGYVLTADVADSEPIQKLLRLRQTERNCLCYGATTVDAANTFLRSTALPVCRTMPGR